MPLRKLADIPKVCTHREHNPPAHMVYSEGVWEWECPGCGKKQRFTVTRPHWSSNLSRDGKTIAVYSV